MRRVLGLIGVAVVLALTGCGGPGPARGTVFAGSGVSWLGLAPRRPGDQIGVLLAGLANHTHSPVTITSVTVPGRGVGPVMRVIEVKIAPARPQSSAVEGGAYLTDPPVEYVGHCIRQILKPVHGYVLAPGRLARVWVVLQAVGPGKFFIRKHVIDYTQDGTRYREAVWTGYKGSVARDAKYLPPDSWHARCVKPMHARFLTNLK